MERIIWPYWQTGWFGLDKQEQSEIDYGDQLKSGGWYVLFLLERYSASYSSRFVGILPKLFSLCNQTAELLSGGVYDMV